jgi:DNA-binding FadR family transcriptional regulator
MSLSARRVLDRIMIELAHHGGNDNGKLPVTYDHFEEYGIHREAIPPGIRELEALGFVEVTQRGRASAGEFRSPNLFRLTCVNCRSAPNPTHEWRRIPDMKIAEVVARAAREARAKKQKASPGNRTRTGHGNRTENDQFPVRKPPLLS